MKLLLDLLAALALGVMRFLRRIWRLTLGLVMVALLALNIGMIAVPAVYNTMAGLAWGTVSVVSSTWAASRQTRADTRQRLERLDDIPSLERERDRLRAERTRLQARLGNVEGDLRRARQQERVAVLRTDELRRRNRELTSRARAARNNATGLVRRMQRRAVGMVTRNTSMVFAEALPLVGLGVMGAGVAWDVWDTCQQLGDMRELGDQLSLGLEEGEETEQRWCGFDRDEIFAEIFSRHSHQERLCHMARVQTQTVYPPECEGLEPDVIEIDPLPPEPAPPPPTTPDTGLPLAAPSFGPMPSHLWVVVPLTG